MDILDHVTMRELEDFENNVVGWPTNRTGKELRRVSRPYVARTDRFQSSDPLYEGPKPAYARTVKLGQTLRTTRAANGDRPDDGLNAVQTSAELDQVSAIQGAVRKRRAPARYREQPIEQDRKDVDLNIPHTSNEQRKVSTDLSQARKRKASARSEERPVAEEKEDLGSNKLQTATELNQARTVPSEDRKRKVVAKNEERPAKRSRGTACDDCRIKHNRCNHRFDDMNSK